MSADQHTRAYGFRTTRNGEGANESLPQYARRPFVGIMYDCCGVYGRLYLNRTRTAFEGHCPQCYRKVTVPVGEDGTDARFLRG